MNSHECQTIIREALDKVAPTCPTPQVIFTRAYTYAGRAEIGYGFTRVKLSKAFLGSTPEGQRQTLIHEAMHLADAHLNGRWSGHGLPWKALMWAVGARPDRCSSDPGAIHTAAQQTWARGVWVHCTCRSHLVSKAMRTSIGKRPGSKLCARCHNPFTVENPCELDLAS